MSIQVEGLHVIAGGGDVYPRNVEDFKVTVWGTGCLLTWGDPTDRWWGTRIVRKAGGYPQGPDDGVLVINSMLSQTHSQLPYYDRDVPGGVDWYYQAFPYDLQRTYCINDANRYPEPVRTYAAGAWGVAWDMSQSGTGLTRLGDAAGLTDPQPAVGTGAGSSPFDGLWPWAGMRRVHMVNGSVRTRYENDETPAFDNTMADVMVEVPTFWYKVTQTGDRMEFWVSNTARDGYAVHPAFVEPGKAKPRDRVYIGRYEGYQNASHYDGGYVSATGRQPSTGRLLSAIRPLAEDRGDRYHIRSYALWDAVCKLYLVEYATLNAQTAIGPGISTLVTLPSNGGTDTMVYHTGMAATGTTKPMQYRWFENWYGNCYKLVEGLRSQGTALYVTHDPAHFADANTSAYTRLAYNTVVNTNAFAKRWGLDAAQPWANLLSQVGGSATTYVPDRWVMNSSAANCVASLGGNNGESTGAGPFCVRFDTDKSQTYTVGRISYLPPAGELDGDVEIEWKP